MTLRFSWPPGMAALALAAACAILPLSAPAAAQDLDVSAIEETGPHAAHVVAPGETLGAIAKKYHAPLADVVRANPGLDPDRLSVGQSLIIPPRRETQTLPDSLPEPPATAEIGPTRQYRVVTGDTLSSIAARFNVTAGDIVKANAPLDPDRIAAGQTLSIPVLKNAGAAPASIRSITPEPRAPLVIDFQ